MRHPAQFVTELRTWFRAHARDLPWRHTRDPYAIWVAEVMLQQTQVETVVSYWLRWMRELPNLASLARADPDHVLRLWAGLGYYRRARQLHRAAAHILQNHGGRFPDRFEEVLELPGIGRYTAGAICSIAFNQPTPILDGNVKRVLARILALRRSPDAAPSLARLWRQATELVQTAASIPSASIRPARAGRGPKRRDDSPCGDLNEALMELGALVCVPRVPDCPSCPVRGHCTAFAAGLTRRIPLPAQRRTTIPRRAAAGILRRGHRFFLRQRPAAGLNGGLWEFPACDIPRETDPASVLASELGVPTVQTRLLGVIRHSITRYRIRLEVYAVSLPGTTPRGGAWMRLEEIGRLPLAAAHQRIVGRFLHPKNRATAPPKPHFQRYRWVHGSMTP